MPIEPREENELAIIVRDNLKELIEDIKSPKTILANICTVSKSTVSRWFSDKPKLPTLNSLMQIAKYFGITVDTLLTKSGEDDLDAEMNRTYTDIFRMLRELIGLGIIDCDDVQDFILKKLCEIYVDASDISRVSPDEIAKWVKDVNIRFSIPYTNKEVDEIKYKILGDSQEYLECDKNIAEYLYNYGKGIKTMDRIQSLENLAYACNDPKKVKEAAEFLLEIAED